MTRTINQQFHGLRIFALIGAFAITAAAALGNVGDAAANGQNSVQSRADGVRQLQIQGTASRVVVPGVSTGADLEHVEGSGGRDNLSPANPAPGAPADLPSDTPASTVTASPAVPEASAVLAAPTITPPPSTVPASPTATPPVATPTPTTPAPTPTAAPAVYSGACPALIYNALGVAGCKISYCESGWRANAVGGSGELGWFQVHPRWHADATLDPAGNVAAAVRISNGGTNWSAWSVRGVLQTGRCPNGTIPPV